MRWIKPSLRTSIYGLLGGTPPTESTLESRIEGIRQAMLDALGELGARHYPAIARRVRYADDAQGLWYVRGELMAALSAMQSEAAARQTITDITQMFQGLLPSSLMSRPSRLVG